MPRLLLLVISIAAAANLATAQAHGTDLLFSCSNGALLRHQPPAAIRTVSTYTVPLGRIAVDVDNRSLVALELAGGLVRVDPVSGAVLATVWRGAPFRNNLSALAVDRNGDFLVADSPTILTKPYLTTVYRVRRDGSAVTTLTTLMGRFIASILADPSSGDWIFADSPHNAPVPSLLHLDPSTFQVTSQIGTSQSRIGDLAADPHRARIYVAGAASDPLLHYDPVSRRVVGTLTTGLSISAATCDRSPSLSGELLHLGTSSGAILRSDRAGAVIGSVAGSSALVNGLVHDRSRNLATILTRAPNNRTVRVSFPGEAGRAYVLACSLSGFAPGLPLPDGRVIPLNPDPVFFATSRAGLPPLLVGSVGVLNAQGEAGASLNANAISSAVRGLRIWMAAVTIDARAPFGISRISGPMALVL